MMYYSIFNTLFRVCMALWAGGLFVSELLCVGVVDVDGGGGDGRGGTFFI